MRPIVGIVGYGIVGRATQYGLSNAADFRIYDNNPKMGKNTLEEVCKDSRYIFLAVPTPMDISTGKFDSSIIDDIIEKVNQLVEGTKKIVVIKSTVVPGTTSGYKIKYPNMRLVVSPEFLRESFYQLDAINPSRIIFGGDIEDTKELERLFRVSFPYTQIFHTDSTTAEMVKYTANCFLMTKVVFFNEIYQVCQKLGIEYKEVCKLVIADGRIGNSHLEVPGFDGFMGAGGKCFPKDLNALIAVAKELGVNPTILESVWKKNLEVREKQDWLEIPGATS